MQKRSKRVHLTAAFQRAAACPPDPQAPLPKLSSSSCYFHTDPAVHKYTSSVLSSSTASYTTTPHFLPEQQLVPAGSSKRVQVPTAPVTTHSTSEGCRTAAQAVLQQRLVHILTLRACTLARTSASWAWAAAKAVCFLDRLSCAVFSLSLLGATSLATEPYVSMARTHRHRPLAAKDTLPTACIQDHRGLLCYGSIGRALVEQVQFHRSVSQSGRATAGAAAVKASKVLMACLEMARKLLVSLSALSSC